MNNLRQFKNRKGGKESASTRKQWKTRTKTKFVHESTRSYQRTKGLESQPKGKHRDFLNHFRFTTLKPIFAFSCGTVQHTGPLLAAWLLPPLMLPEKGQIVFTHFRWRQCIQTCSECMERPLLGTCTPLHSCAMSTIAFTLPKIYNLKVICWPHPLQLPSAQVPYWTASYNVNTI